MTAPIARDEVERILAASGKGCGPVIAAKLARSLLAAYDEIDRLRADAQAAVALVVERAAKIATRHWEGEPEDTIAMEAEIRALAPDAGTAELAKLRERAEKAEADLDQLADRHSSYLAAGAKVRTERDTLAASLAAQTALVATLTGAVTKQLSEARETFCYASPGSDEEFTSLLLGFDTAAGIIRDAIEAAEVANMTPEQRANYQLALDIRAVAKGIAEGQTKG